jgi:hypothetical protein
MPIACCVPVSQIIVSCMHANQHSAHAARPPHHTHPPPARHPIADYYKDADIRMQSRRSSMPFVVVSVLVAVAALVRAAPQHDFKLIAISEEEEAE